MAKVFLQSLGCNKNLVDSEIMLGSLRNFEITNDPSVADVLIVNTCGFIQSAKEESIRAILELIECKKSGSILAVTGCLMQRYKDELMQELPEVDIFSGVGDFNQIDVLIAERLSQNNEKISKFSDETFLQTTQERVITGSNFHAYIKIAEGCNQKCSFCAIPTFKGKLKSRKIADIVAEVENLVNRGFYDFSFIAQDTSGFGRDFGENDALISLIKAVEKIKGVRFARILYLYPSTTSFELLETIAKSSVFVNYFDMPIQHISEKMLKIMKRGSGEKKLRELLNFMRNLPNSFLRTGVIIGHPGESEAEFNELCEFLSEFKFDRISAFAYSKEEDTESFKMEQIPQNVIKSRLNKIAKITQKSINESFASLVGTTQIAEITGFSSEGEFFYGAKLALWDFEIDGEILINDSELENIETGEIYEVEISEFSGGKLLGKITRKIKN